MASKAPAPAAAPAPAPVPFDAHEHYSKGAATFDSAPQQKLTPQEYMAQAHYKAAVKPWTTFINIAKVCVANRLQREETQQSFRVIYHPADEELEEKVM